MKMQANIVDWSDPVQYYKGGCPTDEQETDIGVGEWYEFTPDSTFTMDGGDAIRIAVNAKEDQTKATPGYRYDSGLPGFGIQQKNVYWGYTTGVWGAIGSWPGYNSRRKTSFYLEYTARTWEYLSGELSGKAPDGALAGRSAEGSMSGRAPGGALDGRAPGGAISGKKADGTIVYKGGS